MIAWRRSRHASKHREGGFGSAHASTAGSWHILNYEIADQTRAGSLLGCERVVQDFSRADGNNRQRPRLLVARDAWASTESHRRSALL